MPYDLTHTPVSRKLRLVVDRVDDESVIVRCNDSGSFRLRFAGRLIRGARALYQVRVRVDSVGTQGGDVPRPRAGPVQTDARTLNLKLTIRAPDGREFSADTVTLADLARYRDARGVTQGQWSFSVVGQSAPIFVSAGESRVTIGESSVSIKLLEHVPSKSAPLLLSGLVASRGTQRFAFDLFRVGRFRASVRSVLPFLSSSWRGTLRLKDPSGAVVASSTTPQLDFPWDPLESTCRHASLSIL